jgi:Tripartite tricarboxylate transporter family receptor
MIDFAPIGLVAWAPVMIVARKDFPPRDLKEFGTYVKANAQKLNMAHAGVGSVSFSCGLLVNSVLGVKPTLVPFNGAAPAITSSPLYIVLQRHRENGVDVYKFAIASLSVYLENRRICWGFSPKCIRIFCAFPRPRWCKASC